MAVVLNVGLNVMMTIDEKVETRLRKLLALAERGRGGEKVNAKVILAILLKKHGLTLSDISDEEKSRCWFKYKGKTQERLLAQVILKTAGRDVSLWERKPKGSKVGADVTKCQMVEIEMLFDIYKVALSEELDFAFEAFIHKNNIFPPPSGEKFEREETDDSRQKARLMAARMMYMKEVKIRKQWPENI